MPRGITIPLTWPEASAIGIVTLLIAASGLVVLVLHPARNTRGDILAGLLGRKGATNLLTLSLTAIWLAIFLTLLGGLLWTLEDLVMAVRDAASTPTDRRWLLATLAALTTVLGAVIALPFTLRKTLFDARSTDATEENLKTDLLNTAVAGLSAEKKTDRIGRVVTWEREGAEDTALEWKGQPLALPEGARITKRDTWQVFSETLPNLEVRTGAILALERLSQKNDDLHVQIMQILCAYIRENSPAQDAVPMPKMDIFEDGRRLRADWEDRFEAYESRLEEAVGALPQMRGDIQMALHVLGRRDDSRRLIEAQWGSPPDQAPSMDPLHLSRIPKPPRQSWSDAPAAWDAFLKDLEIWDKNVRAHKGYRLDLRGTNLQRADLSEANLAGARMERAQMQGANLRSAQMQNAILWKAQMQNADVWDTQMQSAYLWDTQMQSAYLWDAQMQSALLVRTQMQNADLGRAQVQNTIFGAAQMQNANLSGAQMQNATLSLAQMQNATLSLAQMQNANLISADLTDARHLPNLTNAFGDASTRLPGGITPTDPRWPAHWPKVRLGNPWNEYPKWRADPEGYDPGAAEGDAP